MKKYYVHTETDEDGNHEVHDEDCFRLPEPKNREYLGQFSNCKSAVKKAKNDYDNVDGCYHCSKECHTG